MNTRQIIILVIIAILFGILGIIAGRYIGKPADPSGPAVRQVAEQVESLPAFTLYDLDGQPVTRDDLLADEKALLINFWATWCKPCREEMPLLTEMQEKYADRLLIVGIAIDNAEAVTDFLQFLGGVNYPILLGRQELDAIEIAHAMGIDLIGLPISLTTDKTGRIIEIHTGEVDEAEAIALIEGAL